MTSLRVVKALLLAVLSSGCAHSPAAAPSAVHAIVVRLRPGDDLKLELEALAKRENLEAAAIGSGVGSLEMTALRFANQPSPTVLDGYREIVSLVGTLDRRGSHLHLAVSDKNGVTVGGHLLSGSRVYTTAELVLLVFPDVRFARERDATYGYEELVVRSKR